MVVNLDFANDALPYDAAVNVSDLINLTDVMEAFGLGPNGGEPASLHPVTLPRASKPLTRRVPPPRPRLQA